MWIKELLVDRELIIITIQQDIKKVANIQSTALIIILLNMLIIKDVV